MALTKFIKPFVSSFGKDKWKSRNAEVRKKAVQELAVSDQQTITHIALNDSEESIKIIAINKSNDLDLLQTIIMKGTNPAVKKAAELRYYQLLSGIKHPVPDYTQREQIIHGSRNPALLEFIAENAIEPEFRQIAIKRINRDALLGNIALKDAHADVRLAAAQQIAKRSTLERVVKQSRRKDKRVYKTVKAKLDNIIEDEERPLILAKEVEDICYQLERLHKRGRLLQEKSTYENYLNRWQEISNFANQDIQQRLSNACTQINEGLETLELEKVQQQEIIQSLESMLTQLSDTMDELLKARVLHDNESIATHTNTLKTLRNTWTDTVSKLSNDETQSLNSRFKTLLELAEPSPADIQGQATADKMMVLCSQIESMLSSEDFLGKHSIDALDNTFHSQVKMLQQHTPEIDRCIASFEQSLAVLRDRLKTQKLKADKLKNELESACKHISLEIADGHISSAEKSRNNLYNQIEKSPLLSATEKQHYLKTLNQFRSELGKFSSWRNWAHENEREHLAQQAEQLFSATSNNTQLENSYQEVVEQVKTLRQSWKRLKSPSSDELWERFNNACSQTYELCTPWLKIEAQARLKHLQAKQDLCDQLEQYIETMHWPSDSKAAVDQTIDWVKVDKIIRQARKEWNAIGFVDRKAYKGITKRFDRSVHIIRAELKKVWDLNQEKFYHIIDKAKNLHELADTDLDQAIEQTKQLQQDWKTIGPVPSFQRNKLWKKFRKNCDLVFARRQDLKDQQKQENEIILREKEAICENLEALNQQPLKITDLQNAYNDIAKLWHENEPRLRSVSSKLNHRYVAAKAEYDIKLSALYAEQKIQQLELFKHKAQLCTQLERLPSSDQAEIEKIAANWQELAELPAKWEKQIKIRFNNAMANIQADIDKKALIQAESELKQQLCLKYEIITGKESPEDQQQLRREMQVELLNSSMSGRQNEQDKTDPVEMQIQWHSLSNYEYEGDAELDERFSRLV